MRSIWRFRLMAGWLVPMLLTGVAACGASPGQGSTGGSSGRVQVVAAESFWGSIASQIGGDRVRVTSIVSNPNTDPHDYDATPQDGRLVAQAGFVIVNGAGYDAWASRLLNASPSTERKVLTVSDLLGKRDGDNPHFWYSPTYVDEVVAAIADGLKEVDPAGGPSYEVRRDNYERSGLLRYHQLVAAIRDGYQGTPVGASESIFVYLAAALGLDLVTPPAYLNAINNGTNVSPADKAIVDQQVSDRQIGVFVFDSQNSTPDVQEVVGRARAAAIPVTSITETPTPARATFQDWQARQLQSLLDALRR